MLKHSAAVLIISLSLLSVYSSDGISKERYELPGMIYDVSFSGNEELEIKAGSLSPDGNALWLMVGTRDKGRLGGPQELHLWKLNAKGEKIFEINISEKWRGNFGDESLNGVENLAVLKDGLLLMILISETGHPYLVKCDQTGTIIFQRSLKKKGRDVFITRIKPVKDDNFFLFGRINNRAAVYKFDKNGNIMWEKIVPRESDISIFLDCLVSTEGKISFLGFSLLSENKHQICIGLLDEGGNFLKKRCLDGDKGAITLLDKNNHIAVVFEKRDAGKRTLWLRKYDASLTELWDTKIFEDDEYEKSHIPIKVKGTTDQDFLIMVSKRAHPWIALVKDGGDMEWYSVLENKKLMMDIVWSFDLFKSKNEFTIPTTILSVHHDEKMEQRQELRILRFLLN